MLTTAIELLVAFLLVFGAAFVFVGSYGLVKLKDLMSRLHGPTKATTLGVGSTLVASMIYFIGIEGRLEIHELLIFIFLFMTAPVSAYMIAKTHILRDRGTRKLLPRTVGEHGWATLDQPPALKDSVNPPR